MRRIWLIGNGASLKQTPLHRIKDETMGVNKIGQIFDPTYYVKVDYGTFQTPWDDWKEEVLPMLGRPCLLWDKFRDGEPDPNRPFGDCIPVGIGDQPNVTWVSRCEHHAWHSEKWHEPFCTAYNSIAVMAQWAVKLGADEIILVGCDLGYSNGKDDHFMDYYNSVDFQYVERNETMVRGAHEFIKRNCPIPVYNATIGGNLEIYPRVKIGDLL